MNFAHLNDFSLWHGQNIHWHSNGVQVPGIFFILNNSLRVLVMFIQMYISNLHEKV